MIIFTFPIADFLQDAQIISMYRATALVQGKGELPIDDASITYEDTATIKKYLGIGSSFIASMMSGYTNDLYDTDRTTLLKAFETTDTNIIFRINVPETFNNANIPIVDESIKDYLINYVIYRINKNKGHNFESFDDDCNQAKSNILLALNQRTKTIKRKFNLY